MKRGGNRREGKMNRKSLILDEVSVLKEKKIRVQNGHEALLKAEDDHAEKIEKEGS